MRSHFGGAFTVLIVSLLAGWTPQLAAQDMWTEKRLKMVKEQIAARGVRDARVLEAMRTVARHEFVPDASRQRAYDDYPLEIGEGQTISQPYIVALMTELLSLGSGAKQEAKILEVGTGSGYQAAVLAELAREVYTIEIVPELARKAQENLKRLEVANVFARVGDGYSGWPEHAPFDGIVVTAAPLDIPKPLLDQLKVGGKLVIPLGRSPEQVLTVAHKTTSGVRRKEVTPVRFVPMTGVAQTV